MTPLKLDIFECKLAFQGGALFPMQAQHTKYVVGWRNNPEISKWFLKDEVFTKEGHELWLYHNRAKGQDFNWIIGSDYFGPVGTIGLYNIDIQKRHAEVGRILIDPAGPRSHGYAKAAMSVLLRSAEIAGLTKITLIVKKNNFSAIGLYRNIGFVVYDENESSLMMQILFEN